MKRSSILLAMILAAAIPAIGGCKKREAAPPAAGGAGAAAAKKIEVAFVTNNASDFWTIARAGTDKAAAEFGVSVQFRIPAQGTAQEQQQIIEDLMAKGVSGLAISPKDPANQVETINKAAAKLNVITQDSDAPDSNRLCYIGTNNFDAGVEAGKLIKEVLPQGGKIMVFVGTLDAQNAQDRLKGIKEAIKGTKIEIVDVRTDETDRTKAKANVSDTLVKYPDIGCLVGLWSYNGPSIISAVQDAGKAGKVNVVCFDEEEATLQAVKDGQIFGTVVQQPYEFGYQSVKALAALAKGDKSVIPDNKTIYVPVKVIRKENVGEFWANLKELLGKK
ncbi:MAG TPA: sugar-binding protein [Candidatus Brocadiia bacterium]|nr:sugar-binding protein [Candidatus Brocadiia bacterium]